MGLVSKVLAEPAFIGREQELEELESLLNSVLEGNGVTVFISGEAGSGKTRLTREFLHLAKQKNLNTLSGYCLSNTSVPYFPFLEAFDKYFSTNEPQNSKTNTANEGEEVRAWLTGLKQAEKAGGYQNLSPEIWKDMVYAAVTKVFLAIVSKKPAILFIDDLHWADSASLSLLNYLSHTIRSEKVLLLATFRSEELIADIEGRSHPLHELLLSMRREDLFREIKLTNLNRDNISKIAENMIKGSLDSNFADQLSDESQGNALFLVEALRMLSERGSLVQKDDKWCLATDSFEVPRKFKDIILRRLGILEFNRRRILDVAAVVGEEFDPELLSAVLGVDSLEILEALNTIALSTSLVQSEGNLYRFSHAKIPEVLYDEMALPLKRGYHNKVAQKLEINKPPPVSELAHHYAKAGNKEKAIDYSLAAGKKAAANFSNAEAIKHFNYVLTNTAEQSENVEKTTIALEGLGFAYLWSGNFKDSVNAFEQLSQTTESASLKLRALTHAMSSAMWDRPAYTLEIASKAEPYALYNRLEYARLRSHKARALVSFHRLTEAYEEWDKALKVFKEENSYADLIGTLFELNACQVTDPDLSLDGLEHKRLAMLMYAVALLEEVNAFGPLTYMHARLGAVFNHYGLLKQAFESYARTIELGEKIGSNGQMAWGHFFSSMLLEITRDTKGAIVHSLKGMELAEKTDQLIIQFFNYANLTRQYTHLGQVENAEKWYQKMMKHFNETQLAMQDWPRRWGLLSKAVYLGGKGKWIESNDIFEALLKEHDVTFQFLYKANYALSLFKQGQNTKAKTLLEDAQKAMPAPRKFESTNIQAVLTVPRDVGVNEDLTIRLDMINTSKAPGKLVRIEGLDNAEWKIKLADGATLKNDCIELNEKQIAPFSIEKITFTLQTSQLGIFTLCPQVTYIDSAGEKQTCKPEAVRITSHPVLKAQIGGQSVSVTVLPRRVPTGFRQLDVLLYGGIPENYAVILTSPPTDEKSHLVKKFLETGAKNGDQTLSISTRLNEAKDLAEQYPSTLSFFVCNPQADTAVKDSPNIYKFKGVENLTEIDISLTKYLRTIMPTTAKRASIEVVSDVLLQHHMVATRRWLTNLIATLKSKGFTTLAVLNPHMHPQEEVQAVLGLFDGEIRITEKDTTKGIEKVLQVRRLSNQKHLENELTLTQERLD